MDHFGLLRGRGDRTGRRRWTAIATLTLAACGGGGEKASAPDPNAIAGEEVVGQQVALDPPQLSEDRERIRLTWQAGPDATVFTAFVQRTSDAAFEPIEADVSGNNGEFLRGPAWRWDYPSAQVRVRACDQGGKVCATSNSQALLDVLLASSARITPAPEFPVGHGFAEQILLSRDGRTLAMGNSQDRSATPGQTGEGSVWVYRRGSDGLWSPEARINRFHVRTAFGPGLAMSSDGSTVAVGADLDGGSVGGVNAPEVDSYFIHPPTPGASSGAVYVFRRDEQGQWQLQAFIKAATPVDGERMGATVALSGDGNRMAVTSFARVYLFERSGGSWRQVRIVERRGSVGSIFRVVMSSDGHTFAISGRDGTGNKVLVYRHCPCSDGWRLAAELRSAKPIVGAGGSFNDQFAVGSSLLDRPLSLSADGKTLAVGAPGDRGDIDDLNTGAFDVPAQGSIYLFGEDRDGVWRRHAHLRTRSAADNDYIGQTVELDAEGKVLAAKACGHAANDSGVRRNHRAGATAGVSGPRCSVYELIGGAVYIFERGAAGTWSHAAAAIPAPGVDMWVTPIALSADAQTFSVGGMFLTPAPPTQTMEVY